MPFCHRYNPIYTLSSTALSFIMDKLIAKKITKHSMKDILLYLNKNDKETELIKDIAADGLDKNLCISIPYLGRIRKSPFKLMMNEGKILLHDAKKRLSTEDYIEYRRNLYNRYKDRCRDLDYAKLFFERLLRINKKYYNKLYSNCGKDYADRWLKRLAYLTIIEHDINDPNEL